MIYLEMIVYRIKNLTNGLCYIGQTTKQLATRWKAHQKKTGCRFLSNAIKKYGPENFQINILCRCASKEELNHREAYYIRLFKTLAPTGYNLKEGGANGTVTFETRQKMSDSQRKRNTPEYLKKVGLALQKVHAANPEIGHKHSVRLKNRYKQHPELLDLAAKLKGGLPFVAISVLTNKIIWQGINQAACARELGLSQSNISHCLNNKRRTSKGFYFRYKDHAFTPLRAVNLGGKELQNIETGEIFRSSSVAADKYDLWARNIRRAALTGLTAGGFHWKYTR
jgi:group I intron endonuclease